MGGITFLIVKNASLETAKDRLALSNVSPVASSKPR